MAVTTEGRADQPQKDGSGVVAGIFNSNSETDFQILFINVSDIKMSSQFYLKIRFIGQQIALKHVL